LAIITRVIGLHLRRW